MDPYEAQAKLAQYKNRQPSRIDFKTLIIIAIVAGPLLIALAWVVGLLTW